MHKLMEKIALGKSPRISKAYTGHIEQFRKYIKEYEPEFIQPEATLFSKTHGYATTMDAIAKVKGRVGTLEYKTSKGIYPSHRYQAASQFQLAMENGFRPKFAQVVIIRPDRREVLTLEETELKVYFQRFLTFLAHFKEFVLPNLPDEPQR